MTEEASPRRRRQVIDALRRGFATAEVQISETQTPLHRLETVHRRITEALRTAAYPPSAFRMILDCWF
jgi:hypothetical protein